MHTQLIILLSILLSSLGFALEGPEEAAGRDKWRIQLETANSLPLEKRISLLQLALRQLSQPSIYHDRELAEPLFERAKELMLDTPGFAEYYRAKLIEMNKSATKDGPSWAHFSTDCGYIMETLKLVPTPAVVVSLSELLDYPQTRNVPFEGGASLANEAAETMSHLIEAPPGPGLNIAPWLEWRDRVRTGKETFQMKGSEVRYNFDGPVATSPDPSNR